ncbi:hypothetical protein [Mammaliicoccus lentus]|nr:hypothetical protein [Mammaliicoccus lentus]
MYGDSMYLYPKLLTAHQNNDKLVMKAYVFDLKKRLKQIALLK